MTDTQNPLNETTSVLRLITCGSVDDGKSTLIGRLLYDAKGVFADQLAAINNSKYSRANVQLGGKTVDLSLLTDGLEAEREQGITIDVAYRYFATPKRKFIIADTPGHEQYTRNMVTGASTANVALLLIDATRVQAGQLLAQTKRHAAITKLLGIEHMVVIINKMDLVGYDETVYNHIRSAFSELAQRFELPPFSVIPVSALQGDNVVKLSEKTPWYQGEPLLPLLENLPVKAKTVTDDLRFSVQYVIRADGSQVEDFRGFAGSVLSGELRLGQTITVQPSGAQGVIAKLQTYDAELQSASAGQQVTVVLDRDLDVSRGDVFVSSHESKKPSNTLAVNACWLDTQPLNTARKYWFKHGAKTAYAKIISVEKVLNIASLEYEAAAEKNLSLNGIAKLTLQLQSPIVADSYEKNRHTGALILIDSASHQTAAACMVI